MSGEDGGQGPQSADEVSRDGADAFGPMGSSVVDAREAAADADGGGVGTASPQSGAAPPEPPPVPIPEETKAFDDFLTSEAITADESLSIGAAVAATREQIATLNDKLAKASEEDKPALEEEKASLEKKYKEQLGELNTALQSSITKDEQEIQDLCTQHNQQLQTVVDMTPEDVEQIADETQKKAVNEIRKKQAALEEKKRYQQQIVDDTLPEPAPRPQVPQKLEDKGEEAALESDVSAKERPDLNQETEPAQFDPMNASVLYNMILLLISEKSPTRYLLAATCLVAARVLNKPVEAVKGSVCLLCATMSLAYSKDQAKEWLRMAANHGVQALPYELLTPHASSQALAKAMYQMLKNEQSNEQSKAMLPRRLLELAMDRGMSNKATDDLAVAPKGSSATLEPNIPNQQAGAPGATLGANQPVTPAPAPSTAASLETAGGPQPSPSVASSATTTESTSPRSASLVERSGNLRTAANAEPPGGLSLRGTAGTGSGMNTAQATHEALTAMHPEFAAAAAAAAANKETAAQEEKQQFASQKSTNKSHHN